MDKVFGRCVLEDISTDDRIMITSGRVSYEVLLKVAMKSAASWGITFIGFARGRRMNIYTESWRVVE